MTRTADHDHLACLTARQRRVPCSVGERHGFTLMEMLAALTIGMLVVLSAAGATRALTGTREKVDRRIEQCAEARRALEAITGALRQVRRDATAAEQPVVIGLRGGDGEGDRINLQVISDRRARAEGQESDQHEISFFLQQAPDGAALPSLMCRRDHGFDEHVEEGGMATLVAENIVGLSFEYQAGGEWYEQWAATELQPPEAVRVTVSSLGRPDPRVARPDVITLSTTVALHAAPRAVNQPKKNADEPNRQEPSAGGPR